MELIRNRLGYLEVHPKPTADELERHYNDRYFGGEKSTYRAEYPKEELLHRRIPSLEAERFAPERAKSVLDLGCGEGFVLDHFARRGWEVEGADFTLDGIELFFPHLAARVRVGNVFRTIEALNREGRRYDLVFCNNVLEHVIHPLELLEGVQELLAPAGVCRVVVPNDDSLIQREAVRSGVATQSFWVCPPDHLNYFDSQSLPRTLAAAGLRLRALLSEFPIDLFLLNPATNYLQEPSKGPGCHRARRQLENALVGESIDKLIRFREGCAAAGIGRNLIAYCDVAK